MSEARRARGLLGRADLVALLANPGEASAEAAGAVASLLGLERAPRSPPEPPPPEPLPIPELPPSDFPEPRVQQHPLLDTPFWRVEVAEFEPDSPGERAVPPPAYTGWRRPPRHPPVFHPLATWAELAPRLRHVLSDYREGCAVDLDLTVRRISRGQILDRFPRERRRRFGPALLLLEDDSRRLIPYRMDKSLVRAALRRVLPGHALGRAVLREGWDRPSPAGAKAGDWPPPPGTLVLVLGDLGCLAAEGALLREFWRDLGRELRAGGAHPLALFPGPLERCPPELAALWRLVPWERPQGGDGLSPERRAERLLRLVSPASRIEPGLLRAARLLLPPEQADAATEADVWQHPVLIGDSAAGATLDPEQARLLRTAFAREEPPSLRRRLIRLVKAWRRGLPPEIWFDELLNADPEARAGEEFQADLEDARGYFAAFCAEVPASEARALPDHDREWLDRIRVRSTPSLWDDPVVGARLAARAVELARGRPDAGSDGIRAGQIDPEGLPERRWRLIQSGATLAAVDPSAAPEPVGSPLADVASRTGRIDIEPVDECGVFWESRGAGDSEGSRFEGSGKLELPGPNSQAGASEPAELLRLDVATSASVPFPESPAFRIVTDRARLTLRRGVKPGWARAMGRDRFGLWAEIAVEPRHGTGEPVIQRLRWIPPGRFPMGSPADEPGRWDDEGPPHWVTLAAGYWLFDTPCTQALWEAVMGRNPSRFQDPERPVERVSWNEVRGEFLPALNHYFAESLGDDPGRFVLPSEAQWEYACRAGTETALYTGPIEILGRNNAPALDLIAWYGGNSGVDYDLKEAHETIGDLWTEMQYPTQRAGTRKVKAKAANPWGLHDMLGNVWEWVEDPWHGNYEGAPPDGRVWASSETGAVRVIRGGSWGNYARDCRSAYRVRFVPDDRFNVLGFRCARVQS